MISAGLQNLIRIMQASTTTLERLRDLINEQTLYRSGPMLVKFFNQLGFKDVYGQGFPSRWMYTDEKLQKINGTPELDKCIKMLFDVRLFIGRFPELDGFIDALNQYLVFDKWQVIRNNTEITFQRADKVNIPKSEPAKPAATEPVLDEDAFLNREFQGISLDDLSLGGTITEVLNARLAEIKSCLSAKTHLSVIFLSGSSLEGILLGTALAHPKQLNMAKTAPKKDEKVKPFHDWTLSNLIDTSHELGLLKDDVKKFSHALRDFRNYIHPYQQVSSNFYPDQHTAQICWQVLKAAIHQLTVNKLS